MNILAIGTDARGDNYSYGLGDVIRLVRVDFVNPKVTVLEFPRDLWVEIPDIADDLKGQAVCAFVTLKQGRWDHHELATELRKWVSHEIGGFAKPAEIRFSEALPKTRSGKIMRRLLREIVTTHSVTGDVTTLEDMGVVTRLASQHDEE